jgi:hypothetical protein
MTLDRIVMRDIYAQVVIHAAQVAVEETPTMITMCNSLGGPRRCSFPSCRNVWGDNKTTMKRSHFTSFSEVAALILFL